MTFSEGTTHTLISFGEQPLIIGDLVDTIVYGGPARVNGCAQPTPGHQVASGSGT
jgi:hypothetical protein